MAIEDFPSRLTDLINGGWVRIHPALDITFSDASTLHFSTVPITVDGVVYEDRLTRVNSIKTSLSRSVDRAEIALDNSDLTVGDSLMDDAADDLLDNLPAVLSQIYVNINDDTEVYKITRMSGVIQTFSEDGDSDLNMTLIADEYAGGGVAPLDVKQHCVFQYKDGINCTYSGTNATCDLSFSGVNGCVVHFGMELAKSRFGGGATDLDEATRRNFRPYTSGNTAGGGGNCFFGDTPIYSDADFSTRPIRDFAEADPILGFERSDLLPKMDTAMGDPIRTEHRNWFHLVFSDGSELNVTETHPFFPEPDKRVIVKDFKLGMKFRRLTPTGWRTVKLIRKEARFSAVPTPFYNVPVSETHDYYANGFPVSNLKTRYEEFPYPNYQN
jgi:hypothetical protein